ncbi:MAG: response regulator [Candidatus Hydrothermarchaeales archaeon]
MLVDDESDIRFILSMILKKDGYTTIEAANGGECLQRIQETDLDLVILDIMMPGMDGWEVCRRIKETTPQLCVSMLSAKGTEKDIKRSMEAGADRHLTKPIIKDEILSAVQELLEEFKHNS